MAKDTAKQATTRNAVVWRKVDLRIAGTSLLRGHCSHIGGTRGDSPEEQEQGRVPWFRTQGILSSSVPSSH